MRSSIWRQDVAIAGFLGARLSRLAAFSRVVLAVPVEAMLALVGLRVPAFVRQHARLDPAKPALQVRRVVVVDVAGEMPEA
jgi:hypothetical protein